MVTQDHSPSPGRQVTDGLGEGRADLVEFLVDRYAQRLEGALRRVPAAAAAAGGYGRAHDLGQLHGVAQRPARRDGPGDPLRVGLIAVAPQQVRQATRGPSVDDLLGAQHSTGIHAHVDRADSAVAEAPASIVQLHRTDAEVEEHARERIDIPLGERRAQLIEATLLQPDPARKSLCGDGQRLGIAIQPDAGQIGAPLQQGRSVAPGPDGGVEKDPRRDRFQHLDDLAEHDGVVPAAPGVLMNGHGATAPVVRRSAIPRLPGPRGDFSQRKGDGKWAE